MLDMEKAMTEENLGLGDDLDSILDINFDEVYDFETLPADTETQLRVVRAEVYVSQRSGNHSLHFIFEVPDNPRVDDIHTYISVPGPEDDPKTKNKKLQRLKEAYQAMGVPLSRTTIIDFIGQTCWAIVGEETDPQYGTKNTVRSFVVPR